jgi:thioredoxin-related protein
MKKLKFVHVLFFALIAFAPNVLAENKLSNEQDTWTTIDKAMSKIDAQHQFILVDIYTDWCGWCKKMDQTTFGDPNTLNNLKNNFVLVKLNAEAETSFEFNGKTYGLIQNGNRKTNELALQIGSSSGRLGYPTLVILDAAGNKLQAFPGYKDTETMNQLIKYFTSGSYKKMDFLTYQSNN